MIRFWNHITFDDSWAFSLLIIPVLLVLFYAWRNRQMMPEIKLSSIAGVQQYGNSIRGLLKSFLFLFRIIIACLLIMALARPQSTLQEENITSEGIDIVLAMDVSGSMLAMDFDPNRLEAAKKVAADFIDNRPNDRIGLVVFAGESFTQSPITIDHRVLQKLLSEIKDGLLEDGTAIGMGLATSVNRLKESESKSKVVILLTDGVNNSGYIDPITATEAALQYGIRVYTIGVGKEGKAKIPVKQGNRTKYVDFDVNIDEELLKKIAQMTNGEYYRAKDNESLKGIYEEIDILEKSRIEVASISRVSEMFLPFVLIAGLLLLLEILLRYTILRSIP